MFKVAGDDTLYGDTVSGASFFDAVESAHAICCADGNFLVGVFPCEVVTDHCSCVFKLRKF